MEWTIAAIKGMVAEGLVPQHRMTNLEKMVHKKETTVIELKKKIGDGNGCINADSPPAKAWLESAAQALDCEVHELVGPINVRLG